MGSAEAPAAATAVAQPTPQRSPTQGTDSVETTDPTASAPASLGSPAPPTMKPSSDRISTRTRRRTATAAGSAPSAVDYGFGPGGAPRPSSWRANTPLRVSRPRPAPPTVATPAPATSPVPTVRNPGRPRPHRACGKYSFKDYASCGRHADCTYKRRCLWTPLNCSSPIPSHVIRS